MLHPEDTATDPTVNRVYRSWGRPGIAGKIDQQLWRAYTVADAKSKYADLLQTQFQPSRLPSEDEFFVGFEPPAEPSLQRPFGDESYFACGWWTWAYCQLLARYRNYVMLARLDLEAQESGHSSEGLAIQQIDAVVSAMDSHIQNELSTYKDSVP